jgi:hypothetical protein
MNCDPLLGKKPLLIRVLVLILLLLPLTLASAQSPAKSNESRAEPTSPLAIQQELVQIETGFFEAWRTNDLAYFREHMADNGVFWGEDGTYSLNQQLAALQAAAKNCTVQGYGLSDFGALPLTSGAYLITYRAQQYATCNGEKLPVHMNGSSIYVFKAGRWQAIYRAEVRPKNES